MRGIYPFLGDKVKEICCQKESLICSIRITRLRTSESSTLVSRQISNFLRASPEPDLIHKIMTYIRLYNRNAQPFRWSYRNPRKRIRVSVFVLVSTVLP